MMIPRSGAGGRNVNPGWADEVFAEHGPMGRNHEPVSWEREVGSSSLPRPIFRCHCPA